MLSSQIVVHLGIIIFALISQNPSQGLLQSYIRDIDEPEDPSTFGENNGKYATTKSLDCTCGLSNLGYLDDETASRTETISPKDVPWLVLIFVEKTSFLNISNPSRICSGTIINNKMVLTAASCLINIPSSGENRIKILLSPEDYTPPLENVVVLTGAKDAEIDLSNATTYQRLDVKRVTFNPHYTYQKILRGKQDWDIAFIQLQTPLEFTADSGLVPLCLPLKYYPDKKLEGVGMFSLGWLKTTRKPNVTQNAVITYTLKRYMKTFVHPTRRCQAITVKEWISERMFCTNGPPFIESKFIEAQGAPMLYQSSTDFHSLVQYGIVSWDLVGLLIKKKSVRVSTNVSGFLLVVEKFAKSIGAKWCSLEGNKEQPKVSPSWNGGIELNEPQLMEQLPLSEWRLTTTEHRQFYPFSYCQCGKLNDDFDSSRMQGYNVAKDAYPWQVQLIAKFSNNEKRFCSGTIINDKVILTSASCVHIINLNKPFDDEQNSTLELVQPQNMEVRFWQRSDLKMPEVDSFLHVLEVEMIKPHVQFKGDLCQASEFDVALVVLKHVLNLWKVATPICLPETQEELGLGGSQNQGMVLGWGALSEQTFSGTLHQREVDILHKGKCHSYWKQMGIQRKHPECKMNKVKSKSRFCGTTSHEDNKDPANGDHGGPVMVDVGGIMVQAGFVSSITNDFMKDPLTRLHSNSHKNQKQEINFYNEIQHLLPFIDYFSLLVDATWCPRYDIFLRPPTQDIDY